MLPPHDVYYFSRHYIADAITLLPLAYAFTPQLSFALAVFAAAICCFSPRCHFAADIYLPLYTPLLPLLPFRRCQSCHADFAIVSADFA